MTTTSPSHALESPPASGVQSRPSKNANAATMTPLGAVTLAIGAVVLALAGSGFLHGNRSLRLSVVMFAIVMAGFLATPPVRAWLPRIDRLSRLILSAMIAFMLAGQFADESRRTFPFSVYSMFGSIHRDTGRGVVLIYEMHGVTPEGSRVSINAEKLFPTLGLGAMRLSCTLQELTVHAQPGTEGGYHLDAVLEGIAEGYWRLGFGRLRRIEMIRRSVPTRAGRGAETAPEVVWVHEVGGHL